MIVLLAMLMMLLAIDGAVAADDTVMAALPGWQYEQDFPLADVPEPSGLCYNPLTDTLFIVDDGAADRPASVSEISLTGELLQNQPLGHDLEGVCFCSADGLLYVADEHEERIYSLLPDGLVLQQTYRLDRYQAGQELLQAGGNGIEGIEYIPGGHGPWSDSVVLLNQDDPHRILAVRRADLIPASEGLTSVADYRDIANINAGALHFDCGTEFLWVVHSWMNVMELWDVRVMQLAGWEVVPGAAQEAVAIDGQGHLWIGSDSGGLASYTAVP